MTINPRDYTPPGGYERAEEATETWDTDALRRDFEVVGFLAPYVEVRRKADGKRGTLEFTHNPRTYFNWVEEGA